MQLLAAVEADCASARSSRRSSRRVGAAPAGDDRGRHHGVPRPVVGPAARRAPGAWRRLRRRHPRRRRLRAGRGRSSATATGYAGVRSRPRSAAAPSGRARCATPSPSTSSSRSRSRPTGRSARSWPDDDRDVAPARSPARRLAVGRCGGWLTLGCHACVVLAWSLDDASCVLGRRRPHGLPRVGRHRRRALGLPGPEVGWGRWTPTSSARCSRPSLVPSLVGTISSRRRPLTALFHGRRPMPPSAAWNDLSSWTAPTTREHGHHLLVLGLLIWGSAMFAAMPCSATAGR